MPRKKEAPEVVEEAEEVIETEEVEEVAEEAGPEMVTLKVQGQMITGVLEDQGGRKVLKTPAGVTYDV